jgi:hypothetical protein
VNGHDYSLSLAEAAFLSPRIHTLVKTDPTIGRFEITDERIEDHSFPDLLTLVGGSSLKVKSSSRTSLIHLSRYLGNKELTQLFLGPGAGECEAGRGVVELGFDLTLIPRCDLLFLDVDTLEAILSSEDLRVESEDWLLGLIEEFGDEYRRLLNEVKFEFLSEDVLSHFLESFDYSELTADIWASFVRCLRGDKSTPSTSTRYGRSESIPIESVIVDEFPPILSTIEEKSHRLLYRGSRDGFQSSDCDPRVRGHSNLLVVVLTTEGWSFGGYAHCQWRTGQAWSGDGDMKSFLFALKNPRNLAPRRFEMKRDKNEYVLLSDYWLMWIGASGAIGLQPGCNENRSSHNKGLVA